MSRAGGCIICDAAAGGLFCSRHGAAYDRAAEKFSGDEQSVMRWIADAARRNERSLWRRWHSKLEATEHPGDSTLKESSPKIGMRRPTRAFTRRDDESATPHRDERGRRG